MQLNADFERRVVVHADQLDWLASPMPGVERKMLDRIGDEVARATSIVRYAANSHFSAHVHTGGEEFVVLEGVFQDEHGDYPAGSYCRNPPESKHTPGSEAGCTILVKLWQFDLADRCFIRTSMHRVGAVQEQDRSGVLVTPLFQDQRESVRMERWQANAEVTIDTLGGGEIFMLEGEAIQQGERLRKYSWLRMPIGSCCKVKVGRSDAMVWIKTGHLRSSDFVGPRDDN